MKTDVLLILILYIFFTKLNDITILLSINVSGRPRRGVMDRNIYTIVLKNLALYKIYNKLFKKN
jgi:hypothetical protein